MKMEQNLIEDLKYFKSRICECERKEKESSRKKCQSGETEMASVNMHAFWLSFGSQKNDGQKYKDGL